VAQPYEEHWADRTAHFTARGLDLLDADPGWDGFDVACGPGPTAAALAERLPDGRTLGVDFAEPMVARAQERYGHERLSFAVDDAEHLSQSDASFGAVTCSFGLMFCYDARAAVGHMARALRPGGRLMLLVWGRAANVWWAPVIDLIESSAEYYVSLCPLIFFYGLPGVLGRMVTEAGLAVAHDEVMSGGMVFPSEGDAVEAAIQTGPLAGLFNNRLSGDQQAEVRSSLGRHVARLATPADHGIALPSEVRIVVGQKGG
ncbi:MAG: class I SAM-dependent methyltransferase, partial [Actinomycetota bacterium]